MRSASPQVATLGILGGLGPVAHIQFEQRLIDASVRRGARCDQDHPVWLLAGASNLPDRSLSLRGEVPDCAPLLIDYGQRLARAGASFLVVTCNTAHAFYPLVQPQLSIPWLHLMSCTSQHLRSRFPQVQRVGVLATDGTLASQLYHRSLAAAGLTAITPALHSPVQQRVMQAIYHPDWGIKSTGTDLSSQAWHCLSQGADYLVGQGAEVIVAGCTELSFAFARAQPALGWVDPLEVMAELSLELSYGQRPLSSLSSAAAA